MIPSVLALQSRVEWSLARFRSLGLAGSIALTWACMGIGMLAVAYVLHVLVGIPPEQTSLSQEPVWLQALVGVIVAPLL